MKDRCPGLRTIASRAVHRSPSWLNGAVDAVWDNVLLPLRDAVRRRQVNCAPSLNLPPLPVPDGKVRVLVAPANFAGQGHAWAHAITELLPDAGAVNLTIEGPGNLRFATDAAVPEAINRYRSDWQAETTERIVAGFTHVLIEAEAPVLGSRFRFRPDLERKFFESHGLSVAYVSHGTDLRSPRRHVTSTRYSPFVGDREYVDRIQRRVDRNFALLERSGAPVFVSTPDLLDDFPTAVWVPVVVDLSYWTPPSATEIFGKETRPPSVLHTPSRSAIKGSDLIRASVKELVACGIIRYTEISGVPSSQIHDHVLAADVILDQFRLGSYGVAACEAMAAGKVVVGHVTDRVRAVVHEQTGMELPVVEANPDTLRTVLAELATDDARRTDIGRAGQAFVKAVHNGSRSAAILEQNWIGR